MLDDYARFAPWLEQIVDGVTSELTGPVQFAVVPLNLATLPAADRQAAMAFQKKVQRLRRAVSWVGDRKIDLAAVDLGLAGREDRFRILSGSAAVAVRAAREAGVDTVIVAPPSGDGLVVEGTGVLTEPGRYAIICVIPTGADPGEYLAAAAEAEGGPPDVAGGPPHIVEGMFAELTVTG